MNTATQSARHWQLERRADGVAWLTLDRVDSSSNTLSQAVLEELDAVLAMLEKDLPAGLAIKSGKPSGFILGADVTEFGQLADAQQAAATAARGQEILARIENLPCPTVAALHGHALGGGLELALACNYRVAVKSYERTLGLPEVQLGIHPGFGGTVRLVELVGAPRALDMMLTGRSASPVEALAIGLVDRTSTAEGLESAAGELLERKPRPRRAPWYLQLLRFPPLPAVLARIVRARVARRARVEHYPAPYALLDLWRKHGARGARAYRDEAQSIGRLLVTPTCRNLVRVFMLRERLRNLVPRSDAIHHVHVIGAGVMGGDIAAWCASRKLRVSLQDRATEYVEPALERARKLFERRLKAPGEAAEAGRLLDVDIEGRKVGEADIVLEAIVERLDAKQGLYADIEPRCRADAILATNTSSLKLEDLARRLEHADRFVGLHFFNPVAQLPLVEVIRGEATSEAAMRTALAFVVQIGKLPLPCRSSPGFLVNRVLTPYMLEALRAHEDGESLESIDEAAEQFGMPVGPIELADRVGLDVALSVAEVMRPVLGSQPPALLEDLVKEGRLGRKTGHGFYRYESGRAKKATNIRQPDEELADRLLLPLVNECIACLQEGIVDDADLIDAGVVFGTGFAPFRGGPIRYARQRGPKEIVARLDGLAARHGPRFTPHAGWRALTENT